MTLTSQPEERPPEDLSTCSLARMLMELGVADWDVLLVCDGSGSGWNIGAGWAVAVVENRTWGRKMLWGGWSLGTIPLGELMPVFHGLWWYDDNYGGALRLALGKAALDAVIVSDAELLVKQGNGLAARNKMEPLWLAIEGLARRGFNLHWRWTPRETFGLHKLADHVSRVARRQLKELSLTKMVPGSIDASVYDFNPSC